MLLLNSECLLLASSSKKKLWPTGRSLTTPIILRFPSALRVFLTSLFTQLPEIIILTLRGLDQLRLKKRVGTPASERKESRLEREKRLTLSMARKTRTKPTLSKPVDIQLTTKLN
jgi:hypothetical protein